MAGPAPNPVSGAVRRADPVAPVVRVGIDDAVPAHVEFLQCSRLAGAGHARDEDLLHPHQTTWVEPVSVAHASLPAAYLGVGPTPPEVPRLRDWQFRSREW